MSPSKERKKRWRFAAAALTANGMGTAAGLATQTLISDPATSVLVGAVVSGTLGDVLLQLARGDNARQTEPHSGEPRELEHDGNSADELGHDRRGLRPGTGRRPRHGYARCIRHTRREEDPAVPRQVPRGAISSSQHPRHRHLHRGAQRFVRRVQAKDTRAHRAGSGNATA